MTALRTPPDLRWAGRGLATNGTNKISPPAAYASIRPTSDNFHAKQQPPPAEEEGAILVKTADGNGVPIRRPADTPPTQEHQRRPGPKPERKKMATVASVYTVDPPNGDTQRLGPNGEAQRHVRRLRPAARGARTRAASFFVGRARGGCQTCVPPAQGRGGRGGTAVSIAPGVTHAKAARR